MNPAWHWHWYCLGPPRKFPESPPPGWDGPKGDSLPLGPVGRGPTGGRPTLKGTSGPGTNASIGASIGKGAGLLVATPPWGAGPPPASLPWGAGPPTASLPWGAGPPTASLPWGAGPPTGRPPWSPGPPTARPPWDAGPPTARPPWGTCPPMPTPPTAPGWDPTNPKPPSSGFPPKPIEGIQRALAWHWFWKQKSAATIDKSSFNDRKKIT